jgi:alpha-mannosidase
LQSIEARLSLFAGLDAAAARAAEVGFRAVVAGPNPLIVPDKPLLHVRPREVLLSALKPAESGEGMILRLLNPTDGELRAEVELGFPIGRVVSVRLDETEDGQQVRFEGQHVSFMVRPHGLRSVLLSV